MEMEGGGKAAPAKACKCEAWEKGQCGQRAEKGSMLKTRRDQGHMTWPYGA